MNEEEKENKPGTTYLDQLREFLRFLHGLWGILGSISVFFPLSNWFTKIYLNDGNYRKLSPDLITALATLVTLFVILDTFSKRTLISGVDLRNQARKTFAFGILTLIIYIVLYKVDRYDGIWGIRWQSEDPKHLLFEIPMMLCYCAFFAGITKAFMLMGMLEYFKKPDSPDLPLEP
jgi:hypothetical protein